MPDAMCLNGIAPKGSGNTSAVASKELASSSFVAIPFASSTLHRCTTAAWVPEMSETIVRSCSSVMSALSGDGGVGAPIVLRKRAGIPDEQRLASGSSLREGAR